MPFKKGNIPWNKEGKHSEKTTKRMSKAHKGKNQSEKTKRKISKALEGRHFSIEHRKNISKAQLENPSNWKGGQKNTVYGYVMILKKEHPYADHQGYVYEHRLVMEKILNRYLKPTEIVHHKNAIPNDNRPENLELFKSNYEHLIFHQNMEDNHAN